MLELSLILSIRGNGVVKFAFSVWTSVSTADAMYSLVLRVKACCSSSVKRYSQKITVCGEKLPIPHSSESDNVVMIGFLKITILMDMPYFADSRNSSQRSRSSKARLESLTLVLRLAIATI